MQKYTGKNYKIVHKKQEPFDQSIDRATPWGNRFHLNNPRDEEERKLRVSQYKLDLWQRIQRGDTKFLVDLIARKNNNKGFLVIGCWCAPRLCHGDVLAAACDWFEKERLTVSRQVSGSVGDRP